MRLGIDHFAQVCAGQIQLLQAPHFIAEVAAVLAREKPGDAQDDLFDLLCVECQLSQGPEIYATAIDLPIRYRHPLFDTLYHAVALHTPSSTFITADEAYWRKAQNTGKLYD